MFHVKIESLDWIQVENIVFAYVRQMAMFKVFTLKWSGPSKDFIKHNLHTFRQFLNCTLLTILNFYAFSLPHITLTILICHFDKVCFFSFFFRMFKKKLFLEKRRRKKPLQLCTLKYKHGKCLTMMKNDWVIFIGLCKQF